MPSSKYHLLQSPWSKALNKLKFIGFGFDIGTCYFFIYYLSYLSAKLLVFFVC